MAHEALDAGDAAADEHTDVAGGTEQRDRGEDAVADDGAFVVLLQREDERGESGRERDQHERELQPSVLFRLAHDDKGRRRDEIKRKRPREDIERLRFPHGDIRASRGHEQHRDYEDVAGTAMHARTFAND